jgi:PAS domain S-box-containing protein
MSVDHLTREWMQALARTRARAARLRAAARPDSDQVFAVLDDTLTLTDTIRAELAHQQQRSVDLAADAERARQDACALIDALPSALVQTDVGGRIVDVNRAAAALLGMSQAKLTNELLLHFAEDRAAFMDFVRELPRDGRTVSVTAQLRPRDRAPFHAGLTVIRDVRAGAPRWMWTIERISAVRSAPRTTRAIAAVPAQSYPCET